MIKKYFRNLRYLNVGLKKIDFLGIDRFWRSFRG